MELPASTIAPLSADEEALGTPVTGLSSTAKSLDLAPTAAVLAASTAPASRYVPPCCYRTRVENHGQLLLPRSTHCSHMVCALPAPTMLGMATNPLRRSTRSMHSPPSVSSASWAGQMELVYAAPISRARALARPLWLLAARTLRFSQAISRLPFHCCCSQDHVRVMATTLLTCLWMQGVNFTVGTQLGNVLEFNNINNVAIINSRVTSEQSGAIAMYNSNMQVLGSRFDGNYGSTSGAMLVSGAHLGSDPEQTPRPLAMHTSQQAQHQSP